MTPLFAHGESMVWLTGGAFALSVLMIIGLVVLVIAYGAGTFWPVPVVRVETLAPRGRALGHPRPHLAGDPG
jgi:ABC-type phosphate transport system auxiliary subunit